MTVSVKDILQSFETLTEAEQREVTSAILRYMLRADTLPVSDEDLLAQADEIFCEIDSREAADE